MTNITGDMGKIGKKKIEKRDGNSQGQVKVCIRVESRFKVQIMMRVEGLRGAEIYTHKKNPINYSVLVN